MISPLATVWLLDRVLGGGPAGPDAPPPSRPDELRRAADDILRASRYDEPPETLLDRVGGWIGDRFGDIFEAIVLSGSGDLVGLVVIGAAVALIAWFVVRFSGTMVPSVRAPAEAEVMVELTRSPDEWDAEAAALEASGRFAEAVRARYRALVGRLVRRGLIPEIAGRTAGEYVRDVAGGDPDLAPAFAAATELFELAWYSGAPTHEADCARFRELAARVSGGRQAARR